jgi:hypothetical protein
VLLPDILRLEKILSIFQDHTKIILELAIIPSLRALYTDSVLGCPFHVCDYRQFHNHITTTSLPQTLVARYCRKETLLRLCGGLETRGAQLQGSLAYLGCPGRLAHSIPPGRPPVQLLLLISNCDPIDHIDIYTMSSASDHVGKRQHSTEKHLSKSALLCLTTKNLRARHRRVTRTTTTFNMLHPSGLPPSW